MKRIIKVLGIFLLIIIVIEIFIKKRINDETLAVYVNDELQSSIPKKGEALFKKAICDNDVKVSWDNDTWSLKVSNLKIKTKCNLYFYEGQTVFNFDYTGDEQTFTAPFSGTFKLETWGAQGTTNLGTNGKTSGGYGGYSVGYFNFKKNDITYVNVGQLQKVENTKKGTYNGGGSGDFPGGGATHFATKSGLLSSLENYKSNILIVAGGGGGDDAANGFDTSSKIIVSGSGGGFKGGDSPWLPGYGGTQTEGGSGYNNGTFGKGGDSSNNTDSSAGGGGGYYGGGSGADVSWSCGGGGSGYIGNSLLTNKVMYCYNCEESTEENTKTISTTCKEETPTENCAKKGNGYARITLVNIEE